MDRPFESWLVPYSRINSTVYLLKTNTYTRLSDCIACALTKNESLKEHLPLNTHFSALFFRSRLIGAGLLLLLACFTPVVAYAIDAPSDARGTVVRPNEIKWEWNRVSDAVRYQVNVNGAFVAMTNDTYYYSRDLASGDYSMTVQAVNGQGRYSSPSEQSAARSIGGGESNKNSQTVDTATNRSAGTSDLPAPADPRGTLVRPAEVKWEWGRVSGAQQYEVFVDNVAVGLTTDLFIYTKNLSAGEHSMMVRAVDSNGNRSADSAVARRSVGASDSVAASNTSNFSNTNSNNTSSNLSAPRDPRGTRVRPAEIKWEWADVSGAAEYEVTVDGNSQRTAVSFVYTKNLFAGEHTMSVRAVDSNGNLSAASNQAKASTWESPEGGSTTASPIAITSNNNTEQSSLDAPREVRGTEVRSGEVKWEWNSVPGARQYEVYLDGVSAGTTGNDYLYTDNLSTGEHAITVAAIDPEGRYSQPSARASVVISDGSTANNDVSPPPPESIPSAPANDNGLIDPATWNYSEATQKDGYELVFSDEFNGNAINKARWNTQLRWDGSFNGDRYEYRLVNGEAQFYVNISSEDQEHLDKVASVYNPFQFDGSRLAIRAQRNPLKNHNGNKGYGPLSEISTQQPFLSGVISTYDKFKQKYGYFEARIKIPDHVGTFPAFWLHHQRREWEGTQKTEIDIMENLGHAPWYVYNSFHYFTGVSEGVSGTPHFVKPQPQGQIYTGIHYSDNYHVYAAEWKPGYVRYLIDGEQVSEVWNSAVDHEELYLIINMAVGGNWTNMATNAGGTGRSADNRFPTQNDIDTWGNPALEIDYVRVYKAR